jgi:Flp pilus assembly pilin Flp
MHAPGRGGGITARDVRRGSVPDQIARPAFWRPVVGGHMPRVVTPIQELIRRDEGQDLLEYGLLAVLIAVVAMVAVTMLGQQINAVLWQTIARNF